MDNATLLRKLLRLADNLEALSQDDPDQAEREAIAGQARQELDDIIEPLRKAEQTTRIFYLQDGGYGLVRP